MTVDTTQPDTTANHVVETCAVDNGGNNLTKKQWSILRHLEQHRHAWLELITPSTGQPHVIHSEACPTATESDYWALREAAFIGKSWGEQRDYITVAGIAAVKAHDKGGGAE
jgi:hypothetical protein